MQTLGTIVCILFAVGWAVSVWGKLPQDKNGRTDR